MRSHDAHSPTALDADEPPSLAHECATAAIVIACAAAFSSKGVVVKLLLPYGVTPAQILVLRMGLCLPAALYLA